MFAVGAFHAYDASSYVHRTTCILAYAQLDVR